MIQLNSKDLLPSTRNHLNQVQQKIDNQAGFAAQAAKADSEWSNKAGSVAKEAAFDDIKEKLISMCVGVEICNYCENNEATDVEHIYPKSLFPERAFLWSNYLLACGTCNSRHKIDKFAIFDPAHSDTVSEISRGSGKPANDDGVMVNPRVEDPMDFFWLDIPNRTFLLKPSIELDSRNYRRAQYTIELLCLNDREALRVARKTAASYYIDRLERYINIKEAATIEELMNAVPEPHLVESNMPFQEEQQRLKAAIREDIVQYSHPTVWQELKRQRDKLTKTNDFFNRAPEALEW